MTTGTEIITVDQAAKLASLDVLAREHVNAQRPANTVKAFAQDWKTWCLYCADLDIPKLAGTEGALVGFVVWLEHAEVAVETMARRLTGVISTLRAEGVDLPVGCVAIRSARAAVKGYRKRLKEAGIQRGRGQAPAITVDQLRACSQACPDTLTGIRDRAILLTAFHCGARRSEVAGLHVGSFERVPQGLRVHVFGKTDARVDAVPYGQHLDTCTTRAWEAWYQAAELDLDTAEAPAFRSVNRHGQLQPAGLTDDSIGRIITAAGARAGLTVHLTGHSMRSGVVTEGRKAGHDIVTLAAQTGHSPAGKDIYRYARRGLEFEDNALIGIGT